MSPPPRISDSHLTPPSALCPAQTPLSHLCGHGSHRCVEDFARLKLINVNLGDKDGNTPLHYAAQAGPSQSGIGYRVSKSSDRRSRIGDV